MSYDEVNVAGNYTLNYDSTLRQICGIKWKLWKFKNLERICEEEKTG